MPGALSPYPLVVPEGARGQGGEEAGGGPPLLQPRWGTIHSLGRLGGLAQAGQMFRATDPKPALGLLLLLEVQQEEPWGTLGNKCLMQAPLPLIVGRRGCLAGSCDPQVSV